MTRVTNFGLKRKYLEAGFSNETPSKKTALVSEEQSSPEIHNSTEPVPPPKKKRKRTPKSKRDGNLAKNAAENKDETGDAPVESGATVPSTGKSAKRNKRNKERRKKGKSFPKDTACYTHELRIFIT